MTQETNFWDNYFKKYEITAKSKDNDSLGDRMKSYENTTRLYLKDKTYTLIRVDGKAFHTFTKAFKKPFDDTFMGFMNQAAKSLCEKLQCVKFAFVQSDEISLT